MITVTMMDTWIKLKHKQLINKIIISMDNIRARSSRTRGITIRIIRHMINKLSIVVRNGSMVKVARKIIITIMKAMGTTMIRATRRKSFHLSNK